MRISFWAIALMLAVSAFELNQAKPSYSGTWKLQSTESNEILVIEHQEPRISVKYKIEDNLGNRSFEVKANTDGKEYEQTIQDAPAIFIAKWDENDLTIELKRRATYGPVHNKRTLKISEDGTVITTEKIDYSPEVKETFRRPEIWKKQ